MSGSKIAQALLKQFEKHRIIFWYDTKYELKDEYEALGLEGVEKIILANNEFQVKHHILRLEPEQNFLIYKEGPPPKDEKNWLLDVQLASGDFRTDQVAIWLAELGLGLEFVDVVEEHIEFFQAAKRLESLRKHIDKIDTPSKLRLHLLAACAGSEARLDSILEHLLEEVANAKETKQKLIARCKLDGVLVDLMGRHYGYESSTPSVKDFVITLFKDSYYMGLDVEYKSTINSDAIVFLKRWKDSRQFETSFETLSAESAELLGIEQHLLQHNLQDLMELDYFKLIDQKIISDLVQKVIQKTVSSGDVSLWVRSRRQSHWYSEFEHIYLTIDYASKLIHTVDNALLESDSFDDGIERYAKQWYVIDQLYRKCIYHLRQSAQVSLLGQLIETVENRYTNNYLLKLGNTWQKHVDVKEQWKSQSIQEQSSFYNQSVSNLLKTGKVFVIISDALRYEIGDEVVSQIRESNKYDATISPMLSTLPSYTQLGMAALLPHDELSFSDKGDATVLCDGQRTAGLENRSKILKKSIEQSTAVKASELLKYNREEIRSLCREHELVYVYHDLIDATGDDKKTEERVFEAASTTVEEISRIVTRVGGENYIAHFLITSDHGFLYQHRVLEESDFLSEVPSGSELLYKDRRFILGHGLEQNSGFKKFESSQLDMTGDMEVLIPKSINRLRRQGSGSRFVHGGATLQEVVIPLIKVAKRRKDDTLGTSNVQVEILKGASSVISSGQLAVTFYQGTVVSDKIQPRTVLSGIYAQNGDLISDTHELVFDLTSDNPREREMAIRFVLTRDADKYNNQEVTLRLDKVYPKPETSHEKEYTSQRYTLRRSFTSDFDF